MTPFGQPRRHVAECDSTNDLARAWATDAADPAPHGALVTAEFQTRGRGRRGRQWDATPGESALMSFVLRPPVPPADAWHLGFLAALATSDALRAMGLDAEIKWPNDVLLRGSKVAGVLVETVLAPHYWGGGASGAGRRSFIAIIGIGLNVNQTAFDAANYAYPPTSLRQVTGREHPVEEVIQAVAAALGRWDDTYATEGFASILVACRERLAVGMSLQRGQESAVLTALNTDGSAHVRLPDGTFTDWVALN